MTKEKEMRMFPCAHCDHISMKHDEGFPHWRKAHAGRKLNEKGEWGPILDEIEPGHEALTASARVDE